jgi:fructose-bisphosphate aldolase/2-amino-3,7-dideoxy-D-threo-hept-6-ulosonate synthase
VSDLGKQLRLGRIFDPVSGNTMVVPVDQSIEEARFHQLETENAHRIFGDLIDGGANAFLARRGLAAATASTFAGRAGWIARLTGRSGLTPETEHRRQIVLGSVEDAVRRGADAVVGTFFLGEETEATQFTAMGLMADEADRLGIPFLAEVFPAGTPETQPYNGPYTVEQLRVAVRAASEEGADFIKTFYTGDPASFQEVVDYSLVPVIVAGGDPTPDPIDVLRFAHGAMQGGGRGIAIGRKLWTSADPAGLARGLADIVHRGASVEEAAGHLAVSVGA